jgi:hypothetical protein
VGELFHSTLGKDEDPSRLPAATWPRDHGRRNFLDADLPVSAEVALNQAPAGYNDRDDDATATILALPLDIPLATAFRGTQYLSHRIAGRIVRIPCMRSHEVTSDPNRVKWWVADPRFSEWLCNAHKGTVGEVHPILQRGASRDLLVVECDPGVVATALAFDHNLNGGWSVVQCLPGKLGQHITLAEGAATGVRI